MRIITIFLLVAGAGIIAWLILGRPEKKAPTEKLAAITISKNSDSLNVALEGAMTDYKKMTEELVKWDSAAAATLAQTFVKDLEAMPLGELQKDSSPIFETAQAFIENAKGDATTIATEKGIRQQREALNSLTDNFYQLLNTVKYDRKKLYLQECPMAFDDTKSGQWLSEEEGIRNPYLGLHHPTYGKGMLSCGETKLTMDNTGKK